MAPRSRKITDMHAYRKDTVELGPPDDAEPCGPALVCKQILRTAQDPPEHANARFEGAPASRWLLRRLHDSSPNNRSSGNAIHGRGRLRGCD